LTSPGDRKGSELELRLRERPAGDRWAASIGSGDREEAADSDLDHGRGPRR